MVLAVGCEDGRVSLFLYRLYFSLSGRVGVKKRKCEIMGYGIGHAVLQRLILRHISVESWILMKMVKAQICYGSR
jgi:hypothetical protein